MKKPIYPLRILREVHKIPVVELADVLGLNPSTYIAVVEPQEHPVLSPYQLRVLAEMFDLGPEQLEFLCKKPNTKKLSGRFHLHVVRVLLRLIRKFH